MATAINDSDEIRRRMAQIRRDLHEDVKDVVATAEAVTDWRRYIRMYPWAALGVAATVGYLVVPRKRRSVPRDIATQADLAQVREVVQDAQEKKPARKGLIGAALGFAFPIALRAAQGYAVQYLENWIIQQQAAGGPPHDQPEAPGGAGRPRGMAGL